MANSFSIQTTTEVDECAGWCFLLFRSRSCGRRAPAPGPGRQTVRCCKSSPLEVIRTGQDSIEASTSPILPGQRSSLPPAESSPSPVPCPAAARRFRSAPMTGIRSRSSISARSTCSRVLWSPKDPRSAQWARAASLSSTSRTSISASASRPTRRATSTRWGSFRLARPLLRRRRQPPPPLRPARQRLRHRL